MTDRTPPLLTSSGATDGVLRTGTWVCATCRAINSPCNIACVQCSTARPDLNASQRGELSLVAKAIDSWSPSQNLVPRRLSALVTSLAFSEEHIERVYTEVVHRQVQEVRAATPQTQATRSPVTYESLDIFAYSPSQLREATAHIETCQQCNGTARCRLCNATGRVTCGECNGRGRVERVYKNHSKEIQCPTCRTKTFVTCPSCQKARSPYCAGCEGSNHQLVWLTFHETRTQHHFVHPSPPPSDIAAQLAAPGPIDRALSAGHLTTCDIDQPEAIGPQTPNVNAALLAHATPPVDRRSARIARQQYIRMTQPRIEATYRLVMMTGTIILVGPRLSVLPFGTTTTPLGQWVVLWGVSSIVASIAISKAIFSFIGSGAYFDEARQKLLLCWLASSLLFGFFLGGFIKGVGKDARRWRATIRKDELLTGALGLVACVVGAVVGAASVPARPELASALAAGDMRRADKVLTAIGETQAGSSTFRDAVQDFDIAMALWVDGQAKARQLHEVAGRGGSRAAEARELRNATISQRIDANPMGLLREFDSSFPGWEQDEELRSLKARALDKRVASCTNLPCIVSAQLAAAEAQPEPKRVEEANEARARLLADLRLTDDRNATALSRIRHLKDASELASQVTSQFSSDKPLLDAALALTTAANTARRQIPLLGNSTQVAEAIVGSMSEQSTGVWTTTVEDVLVGVAVGANDTCVGVYIAAQPPTGRRRSLGAMGDVWLSQALGRPAQVKQPASGRSTVSWSEGGTPVVARWQNERLVEVRVAGAAP